MSRTRPRGRGRGTLASKDLLECLNTGDAEALGIDLRETKYTVLADLPTATEKARRDAPTIAVCEVSHRPPSSLGAMQPWEDDPMDLGHGIEIGDEAVASFCAMHGVKRLALFGSVLGEQFTDQSDLDVLVEFEPDRTPGLLGLAAMELELEALVGRQVDLRTYGDLSRYFRDRVAAEARPIYAA